MPRSIVLSVLLVAGVVVGCAAPAGPPALRSDPALGLPQAPTSELSGLPLTFVENLGQVGGSVDYYLQGVETSVGFARGGVTWVLGEESVETRFLGARPVDPLGARQAPGVVSYFTGDREDWRTGISTFERVAYRDLWPGIDLVYFGDSDEVKYEFRVSPGADPSDIRMAYRGADSVEVDAKGRMVVSAGAGGFTDQAPVSWQPGRTGRSPVATAFQVSGSSYGFDVGSYDRERTLVIDPAVLVYAGFIGGSGSESGNAVAVDAAGAAYVTGETDSGEASFPEVGGPILTHSGDADAFVAKVAPSGASLEYAGYIGGSGRDVGTGIAVDSAGAAYVAGYTASSATTFPETGGPYLAHGGGTFDAFVAKVVPGGASLAYAGYIGGGGTDFGRDIDVDGSGAAYITGATDSGEASFPDAVGPDTGYNGGGDAFVAKVAADGLSLGYAGYIGGTTSDAGEGIAVDAAGAAYVTGSTSSPEASFPEATGPDLIHNGSTDAFVAKVAAGGGSLVYAGYIGGAGNDLGSGLDVDGSGAAYVTGYTTSNATTFPETVGPDLDSNGSTDGFVAKVSASGSSLTYAGYLGGASSDIGYDVAVDASGAAYVAGETFSDATTFPETGGPDLDHNGGADAFVAKVAASGGSLAYAGYIGGSGFDNGDGIAVDGSGAAYVVGSAASDQSTFPEVGGPGLTHNGSGDAFIAKVIETAAPQPPPVISPAPTDDSACIAARKALAKAKAKLKKLKQADAPAAKIAKAKARVRAAKKKVRAVCS